MVALVVEGDKAPTREHVVVVLFVVVVKAVVAVMVAVMVAAAVAMVVLVVVLIEMPLYRIFHTLVLVGR